MSALIDLRSSLGSKDRPFGRPRLSNQAGLTFL